jgi:hypothetical protein
MGLFDGLFGGKSGAPELDREQAMSARPVLNQLVRVEEDDDQTVTLHVPRRNTTLVRRVTGFFRRSPYRHVSLDELGSFVIQRCDGTNTVSDIVDKFSEEFKLNRREAEMSMTEFLRDLASRHIVALVIDEDKSTES